jgi:hypothetical protein
VYLATAYEPRKRPVTRFLSIGYQREAIRPKWVYRLRIEHSQNSVKADEDPVLWGSRGVSTTPLTELLEYFWRLSEPGNCGLAAHLTLARHLAREPVELVAMFTRSLEQFARYSNPTQFFHEGELALGEIAAAGRPVARACALIPPGTPPLMISRTVHFAHRVCAAGNCDVAGRPELAFGYIDRELDCLRTSPGRPLENGTPSKRALVLDLLLENRMDATPIVAELKIRNDQDALYGFIQCLCAAAHLVTPSQRERLRNVYGLTSTLENNGPYLDLYVIFFEPEMKGLWPSVLKETLAVRDGIMKFAPITRVIRRIEFLHAAPGETGLKFIIARQIL